VESYVTTAQPGLPQTEAQYEEYLGGLLSHGAKVVNVYGWNIPLAAKSPYAVKSSSVIPVAKRWLAGAHLPDTWEQSGQAVSLRAKMAQFQKAIHEVASHGGNPVPVVESVTKELEPLLRAGKFAEAEAVLDRLLEQLKPDGKNTESPTAPTETVQQRVAAKVERVTQGVRQWTASGRDPLGIGRTMDEKVKPLLKTGKFSEAEMELDRVLEQLQQSTPMPAAKESLHNLIVRNGMDSANDAHDIEYLVFMPPLPGAGPTPDLFSRSIQAFAAKLGTTGDGKTRQLGFGFGFPFFVSNESEIRKAIKQGFDFAKQTNVAVHFPVDDHTKWGGRPDLWNWYDPAAKGYNPDNKQNVEWYDWEGTPSKRRYLSPVGTPQQSPHMCYNSPAILKEIRRIMTQVVGPAFREEIDKLKQEHKEYLFAGITVGAEAGFDDYSVVPTVSQILPQLRTNDPMRLQMLKMLMAAAQLMEEDKAPHSRVGYCSLTNAGYSKTNPPADINAALAAINQQFIEFWDKQFSDAGIPCSRIYTHVAACVRQDDSNNAPIGIVFNPYARPGWTTYPQGVLKNGFQPLYDELAKHGNPTWGGVEANAFGNPNAPVRASWEQYLAWHYNHGAKLVSINIGAADQWVMSYLGKGAFGGEAMAAYKKFLNGETLIEAKETSNLMERLPPKIQKIQRELPAWTQKTGNTEAAALMKQLHEQMKAENFEEVEKIADSILKVIGASAPAAAQGGESAPQQIPPANSSLDALTKRLTAKVERVYAGVHEWAAGGRDPSAIAKTMQEKVKPLLHAGKFIEAEPELDHVLEQLKRGEKSTESPTATPASSKASATSDKPKYLIFWSEPEKAGELLQQIGMKGDDKTRLLGLGLPNATFELGGLLPSRIRSAFAAAREHKMAVMVHFDFHLHWKHRPDLWNWFDPAKPGYNPDNKYNVEWHGWDGPPNKTSYLNHGELERMPPSSCLTSKKVRAEITRIVSKVIAPVLREEVAKLKAEGKERLFAGVLVGLEPSIDNYSNPAPEQAKMMKEDGVTPGPLGYRALLDRGFSADKPPQDFHKALADIVQETVAFWCEQFVDAGIPVEKLYPHVAAPAPDDDRNAPIWTAFNKYSRPGWTTYPVWVLGKGFKPIYDELEKHGSPIWAGVEANAGFAGSVVDWETYLAWHYNHGCVLVGINTGGTGKEHPKQLRETAFSEEAVAAYRKFLAGQPLLEKPVSLDDPQLRIQMKMKRVRDGVERWLHSGKDPSAVARLMEGAKPLASAGKLQDLEKLVDHALEMLHETEKVPDVYRKE
jgi:hypothetical protein